MTRCQRCVMPDTVPGVVFEGGVCNFCRAFRPERYLGEEELQRIVAAAKAKNRRYDCIVPISGGRDSSYVLYVARAVYGLKALAVNYDNEFRTGQAWQNIQRACKALGVELCCVRSKRDIAQRIVRSHVRFALPLGLGPLVEGLCTACAYGYRSVVYRTAQQHGVPLILWGESQAESTHAMHEVVEKARPRREGGRFRNLLRPAYYRANVNQLLQRLEFPVPGNRVTSDQAPRLNSDDVKEIRLFDYLLWDRKRIKETVMGELGWEKPADHISTWRIDCRLTPLVNYCYFKRFGCSKACFAYCNMINSGQIDRAEALRQEEHLAATHEDGIERLLREDIGLKRAEVGAILSPDAQRLA